MITRLLWKIFPNFSQTNLRRWGGFLSQCVQRNIGYSLPMTWNGSKSSTSLLPGKLMEHTSIAHGIQPCGLILLLHGVFVSAYYLIFRWIKNFMINGLLLLVFIDLLVFLDCIIYVLYVFFFWPFPGDPSWKTRLYDCQACPKQNRSHDCAIFMLRYIYCLITDTPMNFSQVNFIIYLYLFSYCNFNFSNHQILFFFLFVQVDITWERVILAMRLLSHSQNIFQRIRK